MRGGAFGNGTSSYSNVPSTAELGGNFSTSGLPAYGTPGCTAALAGSNGCMPVDSNTGAPLPVMSFRLCDFRGWRT
jgi:hypothetical protein